MNSLVSDIPVFFHYLLHLTFLTKCITLTFHTIKISMSDEYFTIVYIIIILSRLRVILLRIQFFSVTSQMPKKRSECGFKIFSVFYKRSLQTGNLSPISSERKNCIFYNKTKNESNEFLSSVHYCLDFVYLRFDGC